MNATTTPILSLDHASKSFGAIHALEDVSIHLQRGEAHALVGENGAGKSTLVKILAGVHLPDRGSVRVDGADRVLASPVDARDGGHRDHLPGARAVPGPDGRGEHLRRPAAAARGSPDRPAHDEPRGRADLRAPRGATRSGPHRARPVDRRAADRRDRQGAVARGEGDRHGRAHGGPFGRRGGSPLRRRREAAQRRGGRALHLTPPRGGLQPLPARDGAARRPPRHVA